MVNDLLSEARLRQTLGARPFRFEMQVNSTNDIARDWALAGALSGSVVLTEEQIAGRGRFGRKWSAPPGTALLMSVILRPRVTPEHLTRLTMVGAVSVVEVLSTYLTPNPPLTPTLSPTQAEGKGEAPPSLRGRGLGWGNSTSLALKWPNDVLIEGRKVAGVLTEAIWQGQMLAAVILGIGLNIRIDFAGTDLEARSTSIEHFTRSNIDRAVLLAQLLQRIDYWAMRVGDADLLTTWRSRLATLGHHISARGAAGTISGLAVDVDSEGGLVLKADDDTIHHVVAGEVTLSESEQ